MPLKRQSQIPLSAAQLEAARAAAIQKSRENLDGKTVAALRELFANPDTDEKRAIIDEILDLKNSPESPMSTALIVYCTQLPLFSNPLMRQLLPTLTSQKVKGNAAFLRARANANAWLLDHAEAGFQPVS